jgi:hypothetical protein
MLSKCLHRLAALAPIYLFALRLVSYRPPHLPRHSNVFQHLIQAPFVTSHQTRCIFLEKVTLLLRGRFCNVFMEQGENCCQSCAWEIFRSSYKRNSNSVAPDGLISGMAFTKP